MANKSIMVITTMTIIIIISFIITIPIISISSSLLNHGIINYSDSFKYMPDTTSSIEKLNLDIDIGDIEIRYIDPPVDYFAKIELNIEMSGLEFAGKNITNYFDIDWQDTSPTPSFTLEFKSGIDQNKALTLIKNIAIFVTLRKDINFDIIVTNENGNVDVVASFGACINNIQLSVTKGYISYELNQCVINGNITGITNTGNIELKTYNVIYTQNSKWNFNSTSGKIFFDIVQYKEIGANISGTGETIFGTITVVYKDYNPNVSALFTFHYTPNYNGFTEGFEDKIETNEDKWWLSRFLFYSDDFPAKNHYNISLYKHIRDYDYYSYHLLNTNITSS